MIYSLLDGLLRVQSGLGDWIACAKEAFSAFPGRAIVSAGLVARDAGLVRPDVVH